MSFKTLHFLCYTTYFSELVRIFVPLSEKKMSNLILKISGSKEIKKLTIMKKNMNEIELLQYRLKRYQAMRNGAMCQMINGKIQKLLSKQTAA